MLRPIPNEEVAENITQMCSGTAACFLLFQKRHLTEILIYVEKQPEGEQENFRGPDCGIFSKKTSCNHEIINECIERNETNTEW